MIVIRGAEVYNPARGYAPQTGDLWIDSGRISTPRPELIPEQVIDARGMIIAPAGVEIHTHVTGYPLSLARRFILSEGCRENPLLPSPSEAARLYLQLGYTTVFDAATSPLYAFSSYSDLQQMEGVDRGTFILAGDHHLLLQALASNEMDYARDIIAWLVCCSGGYALKLVNPGGGLAWKNGHKAPNLDEEIGMGTLTQREVLRRCVQVVNQLGLPHPVHIHAGQLGQPGNAENFCRSIRALESQRAHLCHIQFFSYGLDTSGGYRSGAEEVVRTLEEFPQLTCDVGQIMFGGAMAVTADTSALSRLQLEIKKPWISNQVEAEGGNNILPLKYAHKDPSNAVQWATGLELLLLSPDSARMFLTTDHPNGAPFETYPQVIELLMSRNARLEALNQVHQAAKDRTGLAAIEREYSLGEIFTMTSFGPARSLGLLDRGHLEPGVLADIRCYRKQADIRKMFASPEWVMKNGRIVYQDGRVNPHGIGEILVSRPPFDEGQLLHVKTDLENKISVPFDQYALGGTGMENTREVPCTLTGS